MNKKKIKVALIINEYFGGAGTGYGGYGILARRYIAKYLPDNNIEIDVLLGRAHQRKLRLFCAETYHVDGVKLHRLPKNRFFAQRWLKKQNYNIYLSIEITDLSFQYEQNLNKKLIFWIQDPRPQYEWDEIQTVTLFPEASYYDQKVYDTVYRWNQQGRIKFISQAHFLNQKAIDLYSLPTNTPIQYLPNPVEIEEDFDVNTHQKDNSIIFLGRIESVKRGWLFCEIAKKMPQYQFYMLGQTFNPHEQQKNSEIMSAYMDIPNLHFPGHVDGEEKKNFLKNAKILVNTSIHEALPVSFLEALSYGTLLVSNRNPEDLTKKFGRWVGDVLGDGFTQVDLYVEAIQQLMNDEQERKKIANDAIAYVKEHHSIAKVIGQLRQIIRKEAV